MSQIHYPVVENKDQPIRGEWDFKLKKLWEKRGVGEDLFVNIFPIKADANGYLYVCDTKQFKIFIFNGIFLKEFKLCTVEYEYYFVLDFVSFKPPPK